MTSLISLRGAGSIRTSQTTTVAILCCAYYHAAPDLYRGNFWLRLRQRARTLVLTSIADRAHSAAPAACAGDPTLHCRASSECATCVPTIEPEPFRGRTCATMHNFLHTSAAAHGIDGVAQTIVGSDQIRLLAGGWVAYIRLCGKDNVTAKGLNGACLNLTWLASLTCRERAVEQLEARYRHRLVAMLKVRKSRLLVHLVTRYRLRFTSSS